VCVCVGEAVVSDVLPLLGVCVVTIGTDLDLCCIVKMVETVLAAPLCSGSAGLFIKRESWQPRV